MKNRIDMKEFKSVVYRSPMIISVVYLIFSALWIAFSDQWVLTYFDDPAQMTIIQTYKGWFFITLSAVVIFFLILSSNKSFVKLFDRHISTLKNFNAELEKQVAVRTQQLEQINDELESFSYSVSHDLRSPLRAISGYTNILTEDYQDTLDREGNKYLDIVKSEVNRMGVLIDDLLAFSRISRTGLNKSDFNMNELVKKCIDELVHANPEVDIQIDLEDLKNSPGDPNLLNQVWTNLIGNAIKYHKKGENPIIKIGSKLDQKGEYVIYYVKDEGVGFNMKYADKMFGVFQRLHSQDEFEGTGIGLALVKRIVIRHSGKVWAESELNRGSTFYFSLPLK